MWGLIGRGVIQVLAGFGLANIADWFGSDDCNGDGESKSGAVGIVAVIAVVLGLVGGFFIFKKR